MSRFRYAVLENDKALASGTTSGTETIDLPERGILSEVIVQVRHKSVYVDNLTLPNYLAVTKIELLVDGSTVVKSLTARQAMALMWYNGGPYAINNNYQGGTNANKVYDMFPLYLGRFVGDTFYGLDLSAYANPQLRITWDVSQTAVDGLTYDANTTDPSFTYNIMVKMLDNAPAGFVNKYVQSREINSYNPSASGETNTEIPRGFELKGIMFGSRYTQKTWYSAMDKVKLDFDNGSWLPIDMDYENIAQAFKSWFPRPVSVKRWVNLATGDDFDTNCMQISSFASDIPGGVAVRMVWQSMEFPIHTVTVHNYSGGQITSAQDAWVSIEGWGPMQTIYIPMKQLLDGESEAIDTKEFGRIDFKVTTSGYNASAISKVVAEYFKPNGA